MYKYAHMASYVQVIHLTCIQSKSLILLPFSKDIGIYWPLHLVIHKRPMEKVMWTVALVHLLCKSPSMLCLHEIMYLYQLNYLKCLQCFKFKFTIYQQKHQFYHLTLHLSFNFSYERMFNYSNRTFDQIF